ncbi:hypothetical protein PZB74_04060 [Porifericola rhodea]|uniref:hypothetical protein n=1 Tax=Porifericola rhodea TaxID=930972 RepID=UPI0026659A91|nr:hypothetical protein [Porifericola rhodea]WKN32519.1 hypothetical protein PZB74_04060 [Porifericola rhodea]
MKLIVGLIVVAFTAFGIIANIATVNRLKKEAAAAYQNGEYEKAIANYQTLLDSLNIEDPNIRLNLAHSLIQAGDTVSAQRNYNRLLRTEDTNIKSVAYQQMGVIASGQKKYEEALSIFKESLKANPSNEEARYNYELVKELLKKQEEQQQNQENQQNQNQQNDQQKDKNQQEQQQEQDQQQNQKGEEGEQSEQNEEGQKQEQQQEQQGESEGDPQDAEEQNTQQGEQQEEGDKSDEEQSASQMSERLKEMNISEEKARMILEAMRNNEMQYIQQNRRRQEKARDRTKPDW